MSDFLQQMAISSAARAERAKQHQSLERLQKLCAMLAVSEPTTPLALSDNEFSVIAEIKVRSPAEGKLESGANLESVAHRARQYIAGGACALSVLTEPDKFEGSLSYLSAVREIAAEEDVPVMRKDFLVDPYQIFEARAAGADGVLLIARMLDQSLLEEMLAAANALNMFVLLEAFDRADLERCAEYAAADVLIGLNCRDLSTLEIDPARFQQLIGHFPDHAVKVAESGVHSADDAAALAAQGYTVALIGTALMKTTEPDQLLSLIVGDGTKALQR